MITTGRIDKRLLPSISMLAAFDATARTGSFSAAARELKLTHGAVSRQVSALELKLGISLFDRSAHGESLTRDGELYAREIRSVLIALHSASSRASTKSLDNTLDLAVRSTFGMRWLLPRLPAFIDTHPEITVCLVTRPSHSDMDAAESDAAIYSGVSDRPGSERIFLAAEELIPVCAPALMPHATDLLPDELQNLRLIHVRSHATAWDDWFGMLDLRMPDGAQSLLLDQFSVAVHAAVAGLGVAMLPRSIIGGELEKGELICVSDRALVIEKGLYLFTPEARKQYAPVVAFRKWLLETIVHDRSTAAAGHHSV